MTDASPGDFRAATKLRQLIGLGTAMLADPSFARQVKRKYVHVIPRKSRDKARAGTPDTKRAAVCRRVGFGGSRRRCCTARASAAKGAPAGRQQDATARRAGEALLGALRDCVTLQEAEPSLGGQCSSTVRSGLAAEQHILVHTSALRLGIWPLADGSIVNRGSISKEPPPDRRPRRSTDRRPSSIRAPSLSQHRNSQELLALPLAPLPPPTHSPWPMRKSRPLPSRPRSTSSCR